jgi:hypothetical protein
MKPRDTSSGFPFTSPVAGLTGTTAMTKPSRDRISRSDITRGPRSPTTVPSTYTFALGTCPTTWAVSSVSSRIVPFSMMKMIAATPGVRPAGMRAGA